MRIIQKWQNRRITNFYSGNDLPVRGAGNIHQLLIFVTEVLLKQNHAHLFMLCSNGTAE